MPMKPSRILPPSNQAAAPMRGIVLPVVLVMLVLMTIVVLFVSRRGAIDERLAENIRSVVATDNMAQYALRRCEWWLWTSPPGKQLALGAPASLMVANALGAQNNWTSADWSAQANTMPTTFMGWPPTAGTPTARCLVEDASGELAPPMHASTTGNGMQAENTWRKFRLTAEVVTNLSGGVRVARAQSEVRMQIN